VNDVAVTDQTEADIVAGIMGGIMGFFIGPWGLGQAESFLAGILMTGLLSALSGRLSGKTFEPDTSAIMGVIITGTVMLATVV